MQIERKKLNQKNLVSDLQSLSTVPYIFQVFFNLFWWEPEPYSEPPSILNYSSGSATLEICLVSLLQIQIRLDI